MYRKQRSKEKNQTDSKGGSIFSPDLTMDNAHSDSEAGYNFLSNHEPMNIDTAYYQMSGSLPPTNSLNINGNVRNYSMINQNDGNNTDDDQEGRVSMSNVCHRSSYLLYYSIFL